MKQLFTLTLALLIAATSVIARNPEDRKSPHETVKGKNISVTYGRPYKKGRDIFGGLEPYGKVWRTGADEATQVTFDKDCTFGGKPVKAGTYTLFTIPEKDEWTIILNSKLGQWGAFSYDKVKDQDVLKTTVRANHTNNVVEQFTISLPNDGMKLEWDKTMVFVPIKW
jgi:hypothetical protein